MPSDGPPRQLVLHRYYLKMPIPTNASCIRTVHFRRLTFVRIWFNRFSTSFQVPDSLKIPVKMPMKMKASKSVLARSLLLWKTEQDGASSAEGP